MNFKDFENFQNELQELGWKGKIETLKTQTEIDLLFSLCLLQKQLWDLRDDTKQAVWDSIRYK